MKITRKSIDQYANAMFRFETLHDEWIQKCARYLRMVFGNRLSGAVVVDYAFGRGNWTVAFLKAGAKYVYAVDASKGNVERLKKYCREHDIKAIEVIESNIIDGPIHIRADILWVYGILHHVPQADIFVSRIAKLARNDKSEFLFYAYDRGSIREAIVDATRSVLFCSNEEAFRRLSFGFTPAARLRARDDLAAPYIRWYGLKEFVSLLKRHGVVPLKRVPSFQEFLGNGEYSAEFAPHHLLCKVRPLRGRSSTLAATAVSASPSIDVKLLRQMIGALLQANTSQIANRKAIAAGLFNTHFSALEKPGGVRTALFEDFLFLFHSSIISGVDMTKLPRLARVTCSTALRKINDTTGKRDTKDSYSSIIEEQILNRKFRI